MRSLLKSLSLFSVIAALLFSGCKSAVNEVIAMQLKKEAEAVNKQSPKVMEGGVRMDSVSASGVSIRFNYTLLNVGEGDLKVSTFYNTVRTNLVEAANTNPDMKFYREHKIKATYAYYYKDGKPLSTVIIKPEDYKDVK